MNLSAFSVCSHSLGAASFFSLRFVRTVSVYFSQLNNCQSNCSCYGFYRWDRELHSLSGPAWRPRPIVLSRTPVCAVCWHFLPFFTSDSDEKEKKMGTDEKVFASSSPHLFAASSQSTAMRKKRFKRYKRTKNKKNIRLCMLTSNWNLRRQISFLLPFLSPHFFVCSARHVFFLAMGYGNLEMPECYRTGNCYTILFGCLSEMK